MVTTLMNFQQFCEKKEHDQKNIAYIWSITQEEALQLREMCFYVNSNTWFNLLFSGIN